MHFKLVHILKKLNFTFPASGKVNVRAGNVSVRLRPLTAAEREKYKASDLIYCETKLRRDVPDEITNVYNRLQVNRMPEGFQKPKPESPIHPDLYPNVDDNGNITPNSNPSIVLFPEEFKEFYFGLQHELTESIKNAVKIIRWRLGLRGAYSPTERTLGMSWSLKGRKWRKMPFDIIFNLEGEIVQRLDGSLYEEVKKLNRACDYEPLAHELFLEAWELKSTNPRSSLVVGMAAAEVGIKQCIARLVPSAQWLADNSPSPPLAKMVGHYLALLPAKLKIDNRVLAPPRSVRKALLDGVELRNKTTHIGQAAPPQKQLENLLLSVRDLLYLLDYYCGYEWSLKNIRSETIDEMKGEYFN